MKSDRVNKKSSELLKKNIETQSALSLGATEILEVMTQPLHFSALSPLGSDLTSLLMTMKGKNVEEETTKASLDMIVEESTRTRTEDVPQKKRRIKIVMGAISKTLAAKEKK